jgi:hypothetical protein
VGIAEEHVGPADWFDEWLGMEKYRVPGHAALARFLVNESARRGVGLAHLRDMQFDDGISVPTHYLNPDARFRLVPVTMNCTVPPIPTSERAYHVGTVLRDVLRAFPKSDRIAVVATGGLSHEPGGRATSGSTRSSTAGSSTCSRRGTTRPSCANARSSAWRRQGRAARGLLAWILVLAFTRGPPPSCLHARLRLALRHRDGGLERPGVGVRPWRSDRQAAEETTVG